MNRLLPLSLIVMLTGQLFSCSTPTGEGPHNIHHVIVIGVDGLSTLGLAKAETPVMDSLIREGSFLPGVRTVLPSSSSANWASMLTGGGPEQHGVTNNDWRIDDHTLEPVVSNEKNRFPSIFNIIREQRPDAETGSVYQWDGFGNLYQRELVSHDRHYSTEDSTAAAFADYIREKKPLFAWAHFDDVDGAGHGLGHGTTEYFKAVHHADSCIGVIMAGIREAGIADNTMIIITSDHGGIGFGHGGHSLEETTVPGIYCGSGIKKGYVVKQQVYQYDLAATAAFALGLTAPYAWIGRPVKAAFNGDEEPNNLWLGVTRSPAPVIYPDAYMSQRAGGLYVDSTAQVTITLRNSSQQPIHYTLDGSEPQQSSPVYTSPFPLTRTTIVKAKSFGQSGQESQTATAYFRIVKSGGGNGVQLRYYPGKEWSRLPDFSRLKAATTWNSYEFDVPFSRVQSLLQPGNSCFGLVYESYLQIDQEGEYQFYTRSDDGSKLYIDNHQVVDNDGDHGILETTGAMRLTAGRHSVRVEFINAGGGYWLDVYYKGPGIPKQIIPADKLFLKK